MTPLDPLTAELRSRRLALGLPLKTVAGSIGVSVWWLCQHEHGRGKITPALLDRWAHALGAHLEISPTPHQDTPP